MPARIAYAVGLAVAIAFAACYDVPQPECGFTCGPPAFAGGEGTCPSGYTCFTTVDNRCHRTSPPFLENCPGDAGILIDLTPPEVVPGSQLPEPGATNVSREAAIAVTFSEPVDVPSFSFFVRQNGFEVVAFLNTLDGRSWELIPMPQELIGSTVYVVTLTNEIRDLSNERNPLRNAPIEWQFTTESDTTPPTAATTPGNGQMNVSLGTTIEVGFSEPVVNVNNTTLQVSNTGGPISGSINHNQAFASFQPTSFLQNGTQYTITLSSAITDLSGNPLVFTPHTFTTLTDTLGPQIQFPSPTQGQTNVSVRPSITVGFNEPVVGVNTSTFTLTGPSGLVASTVNSTSQSATLTPLQQLQPLTSYSYTLTTVIVDLVGNPLQTFNLPITFTTGADTVSPAIISRTPAVGAIGIPLTTTVVVGFDENVTNADSTTVRLFQGATPIPASVTYSGTLFRATLTPTLPLSGNTTYTVQIGASLQDASGNVFGTPPGVPWTFTTGADALAPNILSTQPADDAIDVALDAEVSVTFDEPVTNVDDTSFVVMNGGTGTLASSNGGRTWTFVPDTGMLPAATTVTVLLTTAIQDAVGNALATPFSYDFTTVP